MSLSREQVQKVSLLARLELTDAELATMTTQLQAIVEFVEQLSALDTDSVEPMAHPIDCANVFREDRVVPSFERADMLANSPHADGGCYLVPAVLGD
ncbi:MAG TPA: Asp-tRNA(Asn)/Glu-tRNA(Gln) amidotransferase subunit GatC [Pirellulales bacterium]|jgi:aspartyl-tRNA(Asn)/glutamyl-tRNA(Gln) amidotransferase subunit C|nr:Asp-tRNA(Asn)/Glu-tRNA(Gln) amidotransferase subunit GatC [Pirellulales bacterium]